MISEDERRLELRLNVRFQKRLKRFVGRPMTPELQTEMMTIMVEEIEHERSERKGHMDARRRIDIEYALAGAPKHGQDEAAMMKPMGPDNMEVSVNAIHFLSGELRAKNNATAQLVKDAENLRSLLYHKTSSLEHVARILEAIVTPEGQEMVQKRAKLKPNDHKKLEAANHKILADLRDYLLKQKI